MGVLAIAPSLPFVPFALLSSLLFGTAIHGMRREDMEVQQIAAAERTAAINAAEEVKNSVKELLRSSEVELRFGKQLSGFIMRSSDDLAHRVARIRRKFAKQYGFIIPEIRISDDVTLPAKGYEMLVHGTVVTSSLLRPGDVLVVIGNGPKPSIAGDEAMEPAFGLKAMWIPEMYGPVAKREGFAPIDNTSVLLTHLAETLKLNLSQLLSYKDMRGLLDRLEPEYQRLLDEIAPSQISHSTLLAVLKALLAERISIRNLHLILEAVAEVSPFVKKADLIADHVRIRLSAQICGDFDEGGVLKVLRLGARWDHAFYQAIRRDAKGEIIEFDFDPKLIEEFGKQVLSESQRLTAEGHQYVIVSAAEVRPYVKMAIERLLPTVPVISHAEISRGIQTQFLGTVG
jgi:flagellar biosynthesis protein FlhA